MARFEKSTTAPTHYVRIYIEIRIVILIRLLTRFKKSATASTLYVRIYIEMRIVILIRKSIGLRFGSTVHIKRFWST